LNQLSGVAAILRYPLPDLDQMELDAAAYHDGGGEGGYESSDSSIDSEKRVQEDLADMGLL